MQTVTFPGRFDSLAKISEFVTHAAQSAGLDSEAVYQVELAVDEACSNIIDHAYGSEGVGDIQCSVEILENGLQVTLRDWGKSFNPNRVKPPNLGLPLEKVGPRGVGLYLMRKMMDEIHYQAGKEAGNLLTMVKRKKIAMH
jgi:serine/threonine-protein kinase RsbW